jgi:hypothetical protein
MAASLLSVFCTNSQKVGFSTTHGGRTGTDHGQNPPTAHELARFFVKALNEIYPRVEV